MGIFSDFFENVFGDDDVIDMDDIMDMAGGDRGFLGNLLEYFTGTDTGRGITSLLGSFALNQSGLMDPNIPKVGYQGKIPEYQAMRRQVPVATGIEQINQTIRPMGTPSEGIATTGRVLPLMYDPNRRPGSGGRRYFTDIEYTPTGRDMGDTGGIDTQGIAAARARQDQQASDLLRRNLSNLAREERARSSGSLPAMAGPMPTDNYVPPLEPTDEPSMALPPRYQNDPNQPTPLPTPVSDTKDQTPDQDDSFEEGGRVSGNRFARVADEFFKSRGERRFLAGAIPEVRQASLEARNASPEEVEEIVKNMKLDLMREYFPDEYKQKGYDPRAYKPPTNPKPFGDDRKMAQGGIAALKKGKYLDGDTDGMADEVPATINGKQPAALSDGEFVIPADVVSHLGNGNSDAGAKILEQMMARVRKERTGNKEQGKEINARKMLPA